MGRFLCLFIGFTFSLLAFAQDQDVVDVQSEMTMNISQDEVEKETKKDEEEKKENQEVASNSKFKNVEKLEVTGSYIKRIDVEGPSPVLTINKEDFEKAATNTVSDYLKESSIF